MAKKIIRASDTEKKSEKPLPNKPESSSEKVTEKPLEKKTIKIRRNRRLITKIFVIGLILSAAFVGGYLVGRYWKTLPDSDDTTESPFDNEGRYRMDNLNYMSLVYFDRADNYAFNESFSKTNVCPWNFSHSGINYYLKNDSRVLAAAPGKVTDIKTIDSGANASNRYIIMITIQFNQTVFLKYGLEPWTNKTGDKDQQSSMLYVKVGDWIQQDGIIARFLNPLSLGNVHFEIEVAGQAVSPCAYFSTEASSELLAMIHTFHADWNICY